MARNRSCQWGCWWQATTKWSSETKTRCLSRRKKKPRRWQVLKMIGTWRCWSIMRISSYVLMCGQHITYVHQVGFGIWVRRWNNVNSMLCEKLQRTIGRTMRTVEKSMQSDWYIGDGDITISIGSRRDGRYRSAQGLGQVRTSRRCSMEKIRYLINKAVDTERNVFLLNQVDRNTEKRFFHCWNTSSLVVLKREWTNFTESSEKWTIRRCRRFRTLTKFRWVCCDTATSFAKIHWDQRNFQADGKKFASSEFSSSLTWRQRSLTSRMSRRLDISWSTILQRRRQSRSTSQTAAQVSHLVSIEWDWVISLRTWTNFFPQRTKRKFTIRYAA